MLMDASLGNHHASYPHGASSQEALGPAGKGYSGLATAVIEVLNYIAGRLEDWVRLEELVEKLFSLLVAQGQASFRAAQKADSSAPFKVCASDSLHAPMSYKCSARVTLVHCVLCLVHFTDVQRKWLFRSTIVL